MASAWKESGNQAEKKENDRCIPYIHEEKNISLQFKRLGLQAEH